MTSSIAVILNLFSTMAHSAPKALRAIISSSILKLARRSYVSIPHGKESNRSEPSRFKRLEALRN